MAIITVWNWRRDSGISGGDPEREWRRRVENDGAAITTVGTLQFRNVAGLGPIGPVAHDDADFAETGKSYAAWSENEGGFFGTWLDDLDEQPNPYGRLVLRALLGERFAKVNRWPGATVE